MNRLKEIRKEKGISLNKLAIILDVKPATISYYESGKRQPTINHLIALSEYFNVSIDYLCGKDECFETLPAIEKLSKIINSHHLLYKYIIDDPRNSIRSLENFVLNKQQKSCKQK